MPRLFEPLRLRELILPNRVAVSPMCTYSASTDGQATDAHLVHLGAFAAGGAGLVIVEATAVVPEGRISPADLGLWDDAQVAPLRRITDYLHSQGAAAAVQLAHAGRKAGVWPFGQGKGSLSPEDGGWPVFGPSPLAFDEDHAQPHELTTVQIQSVVAAFAQAAIRADRAGFDAVEIHAAHGYLLHQFLSPLSNRRTDAYGGSFENRVRLVQEVAFAVREVLPAGKPLLVRLSATDWVDGGWDLPETVKLSVLLKEIGVDLVDVSSGGLVPGAKIPVGPLYQLPFAQAVKEQAGVAVGTVGSIPGPRKADEILEGGHADLILLGRPFLRDPYWIVHAADALGVATSWPRTSLRGAPAGSVARESLAAFTERFRREEAEATGK